MPAAMATTADPGTDGGPPPSDGPVSAPVDDEGPLIDAAVQGDTAAFAALYDRHLARVYRHCYYRTSNRADAEDLAQQTFLQAWRAMPRYRRGGAPFLAWLLTISGNLAASHHRKGSSHELPLPDSLPPRHDRAVDPEATALERLDYAAVRRAILELKPERQRVILLRFIEGFAVDEVAAALGKSANNIRVIQHRALDELRRKLGTAP